MKIGILTWYFGMNYGARAHSFALQEIVKSMNSDVEMIQYHPWLAYKFELGGCLSKNIKYMVRKLLFFSMFARHQKIFKKSRRVHNAGDINRIPYDLIILGSDEIFNINHPIYEEVYMGVGIEKEHIITYAVSCGQSEKNTVFTAACQESLKRMTHISVRDALSADIIYQNIGKRPQVVLDPTLLYEFQYKRSGKYDGMQFILVYAFSDLYDIMDDLKKYARKHNMKIVRVGRLCRYSDIVYDKANQDLWYESFAKASVVVTDSFHGTVFAIKNRKNFVIVKLEDKINKIRGLLEQLEIKREFYDYKGTQLLENYIDEGVDYSKIDTILEREKKKSMDYLKMVIGEQ